MPRRRSARVIHATAEEVFRVVSGTYRFRCGEEEFDALPGAVVVLPPHVRPSWRNVSDEPGQMFAIVTPGDCERLFIDMEASGADTPEKIAIEVGFGIVNEETEKVAARE